MRVRAVGGSGVRVHACWALGLAVVSLGMGCARGVRPPCENPPPIYLKLEGAPRLNPDERGQPLVTQVLVFQTRGVARAEAADFNDLRTRPQEALGDELVNVQDTTVEPGGTTIVGYRRDPKASAVVVMGVFREPTSTTWRSVARLPTVEPDRCSDQPQPVKESPGPEDTVLVFGMDDVRVVNRTPPPKG